MAERETREQNKAIAESTKTTAEALKALTSIADKQQAALQQLGSQMNLINTTLQALEPAQLQQNLALSARPRQGSTGA